jgi:hypothetical protein
MASTSFDSIKVRKAYKSIQKYGLDTCRVLKRALALLHLIYGSTQNYYFGIKICGNVFPFFLDLSRIFTKGIYRYIVSVKVQFFCLPVGQNRTMCRSTKRHVHCVLCQGGNRSTMKHLLAGQ